MNVVDYRELIKVDMSTLARSVGKMSHAERVELREQLTESDTHLRPLYYDYEKQEWIEMERDHA